jgi:hypothetical protein
MTCETAKNANLINEMTEMGRPEAASKSEMPNDASECGTSAPSLADLPTEILHQIIELFDERRPSGKLHRSRLLQTCRAVFLAGLPLLFENFWISADGCPRA